MGVLHPSGPVYITFKQADHAKSASVCTRLKGPAARLTPPPSSSPPQLCIRLQSSQWWITCWCIHVSDKTWRMEPFAEASESTCHSFCFLLNLRLLLTPPHTFTSTRLPLQLHLVIRLETLHIAHTWHTAVNMSRFNGPIVCLVWTRPKWDIAGCFLPPRISNHYQHWDSFIRRSRFHFMGRLFETWSTFSKTMLLYRNSKLNAE